MFARTNGISKAETMLLNAARMALILGVVLPLAETARRINQVLNGQEFMSWFDDYILGAILVVAAWLVFKKIKYGLCSL